MKLGNVLTFLATLTGAAVCNRIYKQPWRASTTTFDKQDLRSWKQRNPVRVDISAVFRSSNTFDCTQLSKECRSFFNLDLKRCFQSWNRLWCLPSWLFIQVMVWATRFPETRPSRWVLDSLLTNLFAYIQLPLQGIAEKYGSSHLINFA